MPNEQIEALFDLMKKEFMGLTTDDVSVIPGESDVVPANVKLDTRITRGLPSVNPIMCAAMNSVCDAAMAKALAHLGCSGVLHRQNGAEWTLKQMEQVKLATSGFIPEPKFAYDDESVADLFSRIHRRESQRKNVFHTFPVMSRSRNVPLGLVTGKDLRRSRNHADRKLAEIMTPMDKLVTGEPGMSFEAAYQKLTDLDKSVLMILNGAGELKGMYLYDAMQDIIEGASTGQNVDSKGRYIVGAAVGTGPAELANAIAFIDAGMDFVVVDSAHGHSSDVIGQVRAIRAARPHAQIIAGNVVTAEAAEALCLAGVDAIKVGVGPGSICTTRIVAGVGVPQMTAVEAVARVAKRYGVVVIADGGVRTSGDIVKLLAVGADIIMAGGMFAGTDESPGEIIVVNGQQYKYYWGMGSSLAMEQRASLDRYLQDPKKFVPEGVEGRVPYRGPVAQVVSSAVGGIKSGFGYVGAKDLSEHHLKARLIRQSANGLRESHPHDIIVDGVSSFQLGA